MRFLLPLPLPRRHVRPQGAERNLRSFACCCPLSHLIVVMANSTQLALMVGFLCLLLACLNATEHAEAARHRKEPAEGELVCTAHIDSQRATHC